MLPADMRQQLLALCASLLPADKCMRLLPLAPCRRLLKAGGVLINITYGEPAVRVPLLQRLGFQVCFYILTKSQEIAAGAAVSVAPVSGKGGIHVQGPLDADLQVRGTHRPL